MVHVHHSSEHIRFKGGEDKLLISTAIWFSAGYLIYFTHHVHNQWSRLTLFSLCIDNTINTNWTENMRMRLGTTEVWKGALGLGTRVYWHNANSNLGSKTSHAWTGLLRTQYLCSPIYWVVYQLSVHVTIMILTRN